MGKLQRLSDIDCERITQLEVQLENKLLNARNLPLGEKAIAAQIKLWADDTCQRASEITGCSMQAMIDVQQKDYVVVSLFPADETPPKHHKIRFTTSLEIEENSTNLNETTP